MNLNALIKIESRGLNIIKCNRNHVSIVLHKRIFHKTYAVSTAKSYQI